MAAIPSSVDLESGRARGAGCVVIHHDNLTRLPRTLAMLLAEGLDESDLVVVDNSETAVSDEDLARILPPGSTLERIPNKGYGNAANHGISVLLGRDDPVESILIATHEVEPRPGAVGILVDELSQSDDLVAVGPKVISHVEGKRGWTSVGGTSSRFLGIPGHVERGASDSPGGPARRSDCRWLDGAFVVYRSSALRSERFREEFFMYYEETELHYRLGRGGIVSCVTSAVVEETANDVPPALQGRNLQWLLQLHGNRTQRLFTVPWVIARTAVKVAVGRARPAQLGSLVRGWREARRNPLDRVSG